MKRKTLYRLLAGLLAVAMPLTEVPVSHAEESDTVAANPAYTVLKDENGNVYDLGGMEIIVRDWWSDEEGIRPEATSDYEAARYEYLDWCQQTYNFTIKQQGISDWGSTPADFVDYVTTGGDEHNYIFTLYESPVISSAMLSDLMFDLNNFDCLDFSQPNYKRNLVNQQYSLGGKTFAMLGGYSEPRTGVYFNKRLLKEAGINPDSIYDMQKNGTWTWKAWTDLMNKVQKDLDNDGVIDIAGFECNYGTAVNAAVFSNGAEYIGLKDGKYTYKFEDPATVEALEWIVDDFKKYALVRPETAQWDYYKDAFVNGEAAFMVEDAYVGTQGYFMDDMSDEFGFVMFPKGPNASDYTNCWVNNPMAIPACYDLERAWKIAFAYDLYASEVPGYENYKDLRLYEVGKFDSRAVSETIPMMMDKGMVTYHSMISNLDFYNPFLWTIHPFTESITAILDANADDYKTAIAETNEYINGITIKSFTFDTEKSITGFCPIFDGKLMANKIYLTVTTSEGDSRSLALNTISAERYGIDVYLEDSKGNRVEVNAAGYGKYKLVAAMKSINSVQKIDIELLTPDNSLAGSITADQTINVIGNEYYDEQYGYWVAEKQWMKVTIPKAGYYFFDLLTEYGSIPYCDFRICDTTGEVLYDGSASGFEYPAAGTYYVAAKLSYTGNVSVTMKKGSKPVRLSLDTLPGGTLTAYTGLDYYGGVTLDNVKFKVTYADGTSFVGTINDPEIGRIGLSYSYVDIYSAKPGKYSISIFCEDSIKCDVDPIPLIIKDASEFPYVLKAGGTVKPDAAYQGLTKVVIEKAGFYTIAAENQEWLYKFDKLPYEGEYHSNREWQIQADGPMEFWVRPDTVTADTQIHMTSIPLTVYDVNTKIKTAYNDLSSDYYYFGLKVPTAGTYKLQRDYTSSDYSGLDIFQVNSENGYNDYLSCNAYLNFDKPGTYVFLKRGSADAFSFDKISDIVEVTVVGEPSEREAYVPISWSPDLSGTTFKIRFKNGTTETMTFADYDTWQVAGGYNPRLYTSDGSYPLDDYYGPAYCEYTLPGLAGSKYTTSYLKKSADDISTVLHYGDSLTIPANTNDYTKFAKIIVENPGEYVFTLPHNGSTNVEIFSVNGYNSNQEQYFYERGANSFYFNQAGTYYIRFTKHFAGEATMIFGAPAAVIQAWKNTDPYVNSVYAFTTAPKLAGLSVNLYLDDGTDTVITYGTGDWNKYVTDTIVCLNDNGNWQEVYFGDDAYPAGEYRITFLFVGNNSAYNVFYTVKDRDEAIQFLTQPEDATVRDTKEAVFSVKAAGAGLKYQWQKSTDGGITWGNSGSTGAKTNTVTMAVKESYNGMLFRCMVTDENGIVKYSDAALLTVLPKTVLAIKTQPASKTVATGSEVSFKVVAAGDELTYQWQKSTDGGKTWVNSASTGAKTATLTMKAATSYNGMKFRCVVKDDYGKTVTSNAATLTVIAAITKQPSNVTVTAGETATFKVTASGDTLKYQWKKSTDGGATWVNSGSTGATTNTLSMPTKISYNGMKFKCVITDKNGKTVTSNVVTLTVRAAVAIAKQPANLTVTSGDKATFKVTASGDGLKYQWKKSTDGGTTWVNSGSTGATTDTLTMATNTSYNGFKFKCVVTDQYGKTVTSNAVTLTVRAAVAITKQPANASVTAGAAATFKVTASGDGLKYQWKKSADGGATWANSSMTGATTNTLTMDTKASYNGLQFKCVVTDQYGKSVSSNAVTLTVRAAVAITTQPTNVSVAAGANATFKVAATGEGLKYQWKKSTDGGATWANSSMTGATTNTLTLAAKTSYNGMQFKCVVTDQYGKSVSSNAVTLTVRSALTVTTQPGNVSAAAGASVTFKAAASGEGLKYQWKKSTDGGKTWVNSSSAGATTNTLTMTVSKSWNNYQFRCEISNQYGDKVTTNAATLTIK